MGNFHAVGLFLKPLFLYQFAEIILADVYVFFFRFDAAEERKEISEDWWGGNAYLKMVIYCESIKCNNGVGELNVKRTTKNEMYTSLAAKGALLHCLQRCTACKIKMTARGPQNGRRGLERCFLMVLGLLSNFR